MDPSHQKRSTTPSTCGWAGYFDGKSVILEPDTVRQGAEGQNIEPVTTKDVLSTRATDQVESTAARTDPVNADPRVDLSRISGAI
jgi:hypothetical protein